MKSSTDRPTLWRYVLVHDTGLAPHILNGVCSLVVCKPAIRRGAKVGDWIVGFQPTKYAKGRAIVSFIMKVTGKVPFRDYCRAYVGKRRDALYRYDTDEGVWIDNGFADHGSERSRLEEQLRDESGDFALISTEYVHFGREGRDLKTELATADGQSQVDHIIAELAYLWRGQKKVCSGEAFDVFAKWAEALPKGAGPPENHWAYPVSDSEGNEHGRCS